MFSLLWDLTSLPEEEQLKVLPKIRELLSLSFIEVSEAAVMEVSISMEDMGGWGYLLVLSV